MLLDLINESEDKPSEAARNLLISNKMISYNEPIKLELSTRSTKAYDKDRSPVSSLIVYPNPADNFITVSFNSSAKNLKVQICDVQGKIILSKHFEKTLHLLLACAECSIAESKLGEGRDEVIGA